MSDAEKTTINEKMDIVLLATAMPPDREVSNVIPKENASADQELPEINATVAKSTITNSARAVARNVDAPNLVLSKTLQTVIRTMERVIARKMLKAKGAGNANLDFSTWILTMNLGAPLASVSAILLNVLQQWVIQSPQQNLLLLKVLKNGGPKI